MKHLLTLLLFISAFGITNGQKYFEIPKNEVVENFVKNLPENLNKYKLDDLRNSTDSIAIRIWKRNEISTLKANKLANYYYKIFINNGKLETKEKAYSGELSLAYLDSLNSFNIWKLQDDNFRGIDGSFVFFEISTKTNYKICSFWSPESKRNANCKSAVQILSLTNKLSNANIFRSEFLENLEPGTYTWGMTTISIDSFLNKQTKKTDFYSSAKQRIEKELNITEGTSHQNYPRIIINDKLARIADLNKYSEKDILNFEILKPNSSTFAIYGTSANFGVVKLKTK